MAAAPRRGLSSEARGMIPWCIVLVLSAHVLLLAVAAPPGPRLGALSPRAPAASRRMLVTLVRVPVAAPRPEPAAVPPREAADVPRPDPGPAPAAAMKEEGGTTRDAAARASSPPSAAQGSPDDRAASATPSATSASSAATRPPAPTVSQGMAAAAEASSDEWAPGNPARGAWLPRPLLSVAPRIESPVVVPMPVGADDGRRHVGVLSLFIDEQGRVRHVEPDERRLPPAMEAAAREAFLAARFSPGQVQGRAVKSRVNVEVAFDSDTPLAMPLAASAPASVPASASAASAPVQRSR